MEMKTIIMSILVVVLSAGGSVSVGADDEKNNKIEKNEKGDKKEKQKENPVEFKDILDDLPKEGTGKCGFFSLLVFLDDSLGISLKKNKWETNKKWLTGGEKLSNKQMDGLCDSVKKVNSALNQKKVEFVHKMLKGELNMKTVRSLLLQGDYKGLAKLVVTFMNLKPGNFAVMLSLDQLDEIGDDGHSFVLRGEWTKEGEIGKLQVYLINVDVYDMKKLAKSIDPKKWQLAVWGRDLKKD